MKYFILLALTFFTSQLYATSFAPPPKERIYSENGKYFALVDPSSKRISVHEENDPNTERWFFGWKIWHDTWAVANSGNTVVWVAWKYLTEDDIDRPCIAVFDFSGVKQFYRCGELTKPRKFEANEIGPIGGFWRIWFESIEKKDNSIVIETSEGNIVEVSLESGELSEIEKAKFKQGLQ
ncbi:hypothetical protein M3P05_15790 [Sansalvadorimonas sp. 2012CJ34-2]|uniref:Uncharacterized protein n=1 Tax=Parendozoicomonas callyspongiae TaxID=2942213 RepID=A0ABT0PJ47_9GAMM|nr:hypothetical protein [Sansalvadorimonas sp. 2012CJ34-2]MCL6271383.1 hypothetical protein [Sansalvadorimonas sp. 2012CJ34-2]